MSEQTFTTTSDPADFTVDAVTAYLAGLDGNDAEVQRVLEAERAGKARKGILEAVEGTPAAPPQGDGTTPGLDTSKADTFQEAGEKAVVPDGEAYAQGYFGHVPSRDGDNPVDLTLAGVTGQNKDA